MKPNEFIQYGLGCLETLAGTGDTCAKETRERIRIMVCSFVHHVNNGCTKTCILLHMKVIVYIVLLNQLSW